MEFDPATFVIGLIVGAVAGGAAVYVALGAAVKAGADLLRRREADPAFAAKYDALVNPPPPPPPAPVRPDGTPVRLLVILQREARLVDFLMEDIAGYADAQIGASVRDIHAKAKKALAEHVELVPVMAQSEGETVTVPAGFDPSATRVIGNVAGTPPFTGTLQHAGWRAKSVKLPKPPEGQDEMVVQPAEVEVA